MKSSHSITWRLVLWLTLSTTLFWAMAAVLGVYAMQDEFDEIFDSALQETAARLLPLALDDVRKGSLPEMPQRLKPANASDGYLTYQVRNASGTVLMHSFETSPTPFRAPLSAGFWQGGRMRVFTIVAQDGKVFVQVADSLAHRTEAIREGILALSLPFLALVPVSAIVLLFIIRRTMAPVINLRTAIAAKDSGNLTPLPTDGLPSELKPIANSVNVVLARLAAALSAEREFAANSAHELRTPIAGALAQAQVLIAELGSSKGAEHAALIEQSLRKITALTEKLLQLARAEAGIGLSGEPADLMPVVGLVVEDLQRQVGPGRKIDLIRDDGASLVRPVNADAFAIVLRNLIENAIFHGGAGQPVSVRIDVHGCIAIRNTARPYTEDELTRLRQRFHRTDDTSPGSGLGLSIVERLLAQMNASLELRSQPENGRTVFEALVRFR